VSYEKRIEEKGKAAARGERHAHPRRGEKGEKERFTTQSLQTGGRGQRTGDIGWKDTAANESLKQEHERKHRTW